MRWLILSLVAGCGLADFRVGDGGTLTDASSDGGFACASGTLDPRFGDAGTVVYRASTTYPDNWYIHAVAQRGLSGVVSLSALDLPDAGHQAGLVALDTSGAFDTSFGTAGHALFTSAAFPELPFGIASDVVGNVYVVGPSAQSLYTLARIDMFGGLDPNYGNGGIAKMTTTDGTALRVAIDAQGRAVVAGSVTAGGVRISRLTNAGGLDGNFKGNGTYVETSLAPTGAGTDAVTSLAIDGVSAIFCGKVIANGAAYCARLMPDGGLDSTFGTNGAINYPQGPPAVVTALAIDSTFLDSMGKPTIVASGWDAYGSKYAWAARYSSTGTQLTTFDKMTGFQESLFGQLVIQPDGKIVIAGYDSLDGTHSRWLVVRYLPSGTLDPTFGIAGVVTTQFFGNDGAAQPVIDSSGEIVVVGSASALGLGDPNGASGVARYCR